MTQIPFAKMITLSILVGSSALAHSTSVVFTPIDNITISTDTSGAGQNGIAADRRFMGVSDNGEVLAVNQDSRTVFVWNNTIIQDLGTKDCDKGSTGEPTHLMNISKDGDHLLWRCTDNGNGKRFVKSEGEYVASYLSVYPYVAPNDKNYYYASKDGNAFALERDSQYPKIAVLNDNGTSYAATYLTAPELNSGKVESFSPNGQYVGVRSSNGANFYIVDLTDQSMSSIETVYNTYYFLSNSGQPTEKPSGFTMPFGIQDLSGDGSVTLDRVATSYFPLETSSSLWTEWTNTSRDIEDFVIQHNGNLNGWTNLQAVSISQNGLYIAGTGTNGAGEEDKGFLIEINAVSECTYGY